MDAQPSNPDHGPQARILDYWRAIELLSPQPIPRVDPYNARQPVIRISRPAQPLPWQQPHLLPPPKQERVWRYTLYAGVYRWSAVRDVLNRNFGPDKNAFDRRPDRQSCLFTLSIAPDGRPLLDSFVLSSCPWAIGRLAKLGAQSQDWLDGFETEARAHQFALAERLAISADDTIGMQLNRKGIQAGRPLDTDLLFSGLNEIAEELGVRHLLRPADFHIKAWQVAKKNSYGNANEDFLNSFFLRDLKKVAGELRQGNAGPALSSFLASEAQISTAERCDLQQNPRPIWDGLSPARFPQARWPGNTAHSLYSSQQFAVNRSFEILGGGAGGLFSINGPPGTGKTTLLREIITSVIVERAKRLAELKRPQDAFESKQQHWRSDCYTRKIYCWKKQFLDHEIVIASSNNRAVEKVTLEIPGADAVDPSFTTGYFVDFATRLLGKEAWAMIAAKLGNRNNRSHFCNQFWFGETEPNAPDSRANRGFLAYLQSLENNAPGPDQWSAAVQSFRTVLAEEQAIRQSRLEVHRLLDQLSTATERIARLTADLQNLQNEGRRLTTQVTRALDDYTHFQTAYTNATKRRTDHRTHRPGLLEILLTAGKAFQQWRAKDEALSAEVDQAYERQKQAANGAELLRHSLDNLGNERDKLQIQLRDTEAHRAVLETQTVRCEEQLGRAFPKFADWQNAEARELASPWADEQWNRARVNVFLSALHLHQTFLECSAAKVRHNLHGVIDLLKGKVPPGAPLEGVRSAWATLFFVIPVVSTTFASFDRLFAHLGRESIGWLLIDEAGQALPQAAAGALWRAKRAIVAGDPRQLEPISTLPFTAQEKLRQHFGADDIWLPCETSVQKLADRVNPFGTYLSSEVQEPVWVGTPLRVHRRCNRPMFDISNEIAYDGKMVYVPANRENPLLPESCWIHVPSTAAEDHWIPAEGREAERLLQSLAGQDSTSVILISPFRTVARRLRILGKRYGVTAGTIHVAQGQEADVVILVLGGHPNAPGAKEWASEKPNLLNVAVSRAKQRLYIIGDREKWAAYPHFAEAAKHLPVTEAPPQRHLFAKT